MIFGNESVTVPEELRTNWFTARPLSERYAELDYEAYMASKTVIRVHSAGRWQVEGYTVEENQRQAAQHATDHAAHRSFAFILLSPDEGRSLGCFYFNPLQEFLERVIGKKWSAESGMTEEAMVTFWVREDEQTGELPDIVVREVEQWVRHAWGFAGHLWRVRQEETRSNLALERAGLRGRYGVGRYGFFN